MNNCACGKYTPDTHTHTEWSITHKLFCIKNDDRLTCDMCISWIFRSISTDNTKYKDNELFSGIIIKWRKDCLFCLVEKFFFYISTNQQASNCHTKVTMILFYFFVVLTISSNRSANHQFWIFEEFILLLWKWPEKKISPAKNKNHI